MSNLGSSAKQAMVELAIARMSNDGSDEKFATALMIDIATGSAVKIAKANADTTGTAIDALRQFKELQFDTDSAVVQAMLSADSEIKGTLVLIAKANAKLLG